MKHKNLLWALAAAAGIVYLATEAQRAATLPAGNPEPRPEPAIDPVALSLPNTLEAPPVATVFAPNAAADYRTALYRDDLATAISQLEGRSETGRTLELDGPVNY